MEISYAASNAESRMGEASLVVASHRISTRSQESVLPSVAIVKASTRQRDSETVCTVFLEEAQHKMYVPGSLSAITNGGFCLKKWGLGAKHMRIDRQSLAQKGCAEADE